LVVIHTQKLKKVDGYGCVGKIAFLRCGGDCADVCADFRHCYNLQPMERAKRSLTRTDRYFEVVVADHGSERNSRQHAEADRARVVVWEMRSLRAGDYHVTVFVVTDRSVGRY
jgi:hypothetical protein